MLNLDLPRLCERIQYGGGYRTYGKLRSATGLLLSCTLNAAIGDQCAIQTPTGRTVLCEVIGFRDGLAQMVAFDQGQEVFPGLPVFRLGQGLKVPVGNRLLGRILDGLGRPLDDRGPLVPGPESVAQLAAPPALDLARILDPFITGQRCIDGLLTLGRGQRVGIFAGSGVGKSTLLGEIAKASNADVNVIALIGERGREVRPFLEDCLGPEGLARSVVLLATCEQTPLMRVRAGQVAITIADHFRRQGKNVLFMADSLTRMAMAQRELGLALGEPPSARGYTPSVFQMLANTVEQMGNADRGSITGLPTVLVDGGDFDEPISDSVRSLVDGHILLDRKLAEKGQFPAVNVGLSVSRVASDVMDKAHRLAARKVRAALATYAEVEDMIRIGAYQKGANPQVDRAVEIRPAILHFLKQEIHERTSFQDTKLALERIAQAWPF